MQRILKTKKRFLFALWLDHTIPEYRVSITQAEIYTGTGMHNVGLINSQSVSVNHTPQPVSIRMPEHKLY